MKTHRNKRQNLWKGFAPVGPVMSPVPDAEFMFYLPFSHRYMNKAVSFKQKVIITTINIPANTVFLILREIFNELRHTDQLPLGAHGLPHGRHGTHLRWLHADLSRQHHCCRRRPAHPVADDARIRDECAPPPGQRCARRAIQAL